MNGVGNFSIGDLGSLSSSSTTPVAGIPTGNQESSGDQGGQFNGQQSTATTSMSSTATNAGSIGTQQTPPPSSSSATSSPGSGNTLPAGSGGTTNTLSTSPSSAKGSGNCGSLKGVCFNGGMQPSMYDKITTATDWITFQMTIPGGGGSSRTQQEFVPMMPFASNVADAVNLVNGPNPPPWLLTFNEPDFSYTGVSPGTPTMSPQQAAAAIKPLLDRPGTSTKFVAPVTADPSGKWQQDFFAACKCKDFFTAYNIHSYHPTAKQVMDDVNGFRAKFSDKPLWVTEVAPGNAGCSVSWDAAGQFMKDIFKFSKDSGFVDRVFWNSGNQLTNGDTNVCNSWLVNAGGNPSPLLATFESIDCT
ncbi:MAG: hypothetical protein Q9201_005837 [Fulgogasparrea decipioides]